MRKRILFIILDLLCLSSLYAQVPYFGATVGKGKVFGYTSVKFRPTINALESYTTMQFGVLDWFSVGTDIYVSKEEINHGLYVRGGYTLNKWFSFGAQATQYFNLKDSYKPMYTQLGVFLNGNILPSGYLFWTSNTWMSFYYDDMSKHTFKQWWYLGSNIPVNDNNSVVPMVGVIHSWKFDTPVDLAVGFYWVYKKYSFYLWGNDFFTKYPRVTVAVDFTI